MKSSKWKIVLFAVCFAVLVPALLISCGKKEENEKKLKGRELNPNIFKK